MDADSHLRTRPSLLGRLRNPADAEAWRTFVDLYTPLVYRYCRRRGFQEADAADVAQEVMTQVMRSIGGFTYDPKVGRFRDWLGAVVRTHVGRFHRKRERQPVAAEDGELNGVPDPGADSEWIGSFREQMTAAALDRIRGEFSTSHWTAFERTWRDGAPAAAVALELGLTATAVYVAKSRVLVRLRDEIAHLAEELPQAGDV
jgi:RNA polymerase sigma factor (sigma-70 family)